MKKVCQLFVATLVLPILICITYSQNVNRIIDDANLLEVYDKQKLEKKINEIVEKYSFDIVIVTSNNIGDKTPEQFADDYFDYNGYGIGSNHDGILLLVAMDKRKYHMSTSGHGIEAFSDDAIRNIGRNIESDLKNGNYYKAFNTYLDYTEKYISMPTGDNSSLESTNHVSDSGSRTLMIFIVILILSFLISLLIVTIMKLKMRTAHPKNTAGNYIKNNSFKLKRQQDIFLHRSVQKVVRSDNSGDSSSSVHTSSSGRSHGGGGGSF